MMIIIMIMIMMNSNMINKPYSTIMMIINTHMITRGPSQFD